MNGAYVQGEGYSVRKLWVIFATADNIGPGPSR